MAVRDPKDKSKLEGILAALRKEMPNLEERYYVRSLSVFGPYARGENRPHSTLNLMVEYYNLPTLITLGELEDHLSELLGVKVDMGIKGDLRPHVKERALRELVPV